jgi:hypothetical protein
MIIVTAADARYFELARDLVISIQACWPAPVPLGFVDLGITSEQAEWLRHRNVTIAPPQTRFRLDRLRDDPVTHMGYLGRPFIDAVFPGHDVYLWIDADVWLQNWRGIQTVYEGAAAKGACVVREREKAYHPTFWYYGWQLKHLILSSGPMGGLWMWVHPHINNGVFALRAGAPHWDCWRNRFQKALDRTGRVVPYDQMGWNALVYLDRLPTVFAPSLCNWIVDQGSAVWNSETKQLCLPYPPYTPIATIHLAGDNAKDRVFAFKTTDGQIRRIQARYMPNVTASVQADAALPLQPVER